MKSQIDATKEYRKIRAETLLLLLLFIDEMRSHREGETIIKITIKNVKKAFISDYLII